MWSAAQRAALEAAPALRVESGGLRRTPEWLALSVALHAAAIATLAGVSVVQPKQERPILRVAILSGSGSDAKPGGGPRAGPPPAPVVLPAPPAPPKPAAKAKPKPAVAKRPASAPRPRAGAPRLAEPAAAAPAAADSGAGVEAAPAGSGVAGASTGGRAGGSGDGVGAGNGGSPLGRYLARVRRRIEDAKRYPAVARRNGLEGRAAVSFELSRTGEAVRVELRHADHALLGEAAVLAVRAASPFGRLPQEVDDEVVHVEVPLRFSLRQASGEGP